MKILQSHGTKVTKVEADEALAKVKSLVKEADALASSAPFDNKPLPKPIRDTLNALLDTIEDTIKVIQTTPVTAKERKINKDIVAREKVGAAPPKTRRGKKT
tara:strand:+ start:1548 stop:1853 length:306 start_codon:yes stop_codon:yes gene_type:complete